VLSSVQHFPQKLAWRLCILAGHQVLFSGRGLGIATKGELLMTEDRLFDLIHFMRARGVRAFGLLALLAFTAAAVPAQQPPAAKKLGASARRALR